MAQRWAQQKMIMARKHGSSVSGAGRATGDVWEDRNIGRVDTRVPGEIKPKIRNVVLKPKHERQPYRSPWAF